MQKFLSTHRAVIIQTASYLYILLFVYAAVSKMLEFGDFRIQLAQSPMLSAYAAIIAVLVPLLEIITAILLYFDRTRNLGFLSGFVIMIMFSSYIYIILEYSVYIPCSCGGIIEKLGWTEHLVFNLIFVFLAIVGWLLSRPVRQTKGRILKDVLILGTIGILGIVAVTLLFFSSERIIYHENPFIRRYSYGVTQSGEMDLGGNAYYFAGDKTDTIFLGNFRSPLLVTLIDTALKAPAIKIINIREADLPSNASQVRVIPPDFYFIDGQISRILVGNTTDWKVFRRLDGTIRFSNYQVIGNHKIAFRTFSPGKPVQILGYLSLTDSLHYQLVPGLLEKQVDGNFDVDGILNYDRDTRQVVYTYFYRNSFLITDSVLALKTRENTIDTITRVQLVIDTLSDTNQKALISALMVNASAFAAKGFLYVKSKIKGRYQPDKTWKQTETIDVYELQTGDYRTSFYIYIISGEPLRQFYISGNNFYGLTGNSLVRYNLESLLKKNQKEYRAMSGEGRKPVKRVDRN